MSRWGGCRYDTIVTRGFVDDSLSWGRTALGAVGYGAGGDRDGGLHCACVADDGFLGWSLTTRGAVGYVTERDRRWEFGRYCAWEKVWEMLCEVEVLWMLHEKEYGYHYHVF